MEPEVEHFNENDYIVTVTGTKISRKANLCCLQQITIVSTSVVRENVNIRGDLAPVDIGRYCILQPGVVISPALKKVVRGKSYSKVSIADHVFIGENTVLNAVQIGSSVYVGKNCIIGEGCRLRTGCTVLDNSVLAADTVVPSLCIMEGNPARIVDYSHPVAVEQINQFTKTTFNNFIKKS